MRSAGEHDLLPWFVNGSLSTEERAAFEVHLEACERCRSDREWLDTMREELELHGSDFLAKHPTVDELVAAVAPESAEGELDPGAASAVRRHLALCGTCAEEAGWIRGERAARAPVTRVRPARALHVWYWVAASVLIAVLATLPFWLRGRVRPPDAEVARIVFIPATRRQVPDPTRVRVASGAEALVLLFPVDVGREDFPASLEITTVTGLLVSHKDGIAPEDLYQGTYLALQIRSDMLPDGSYIARLRVGGLGGAPIEYPFQVVR